MKYFNILNESRILQDCVWWKWFSSEWPTYKTLTTVKRHKDHYYYGAQDLFTLKVYSDFADTDRYMPLVMRKPVKAAETQDRDFILNQLKYPEAAYDIINADSFHTTISGLEQELKNMGYDGKSRSSLNIQNVRKYATTTMLFNLLNEELVKKPDSYFEQLVDWEIYMANESEKRGFEDTSVVLIDDAEKLGYNAILDWMDALVFWDMDIFDPIYKNIEPLTNEEVATLEKNYSAIIENGKVDEVLAVINKIRQPKRV